VLVVGHPSGGRRGAHCGLDLFVEAPEQRLCLFLALAGIGRRKGAASRRGSMPSRSGYAGEGCVFNGFLFYGEPTYSLPARSGGGVCYGSFGGSLWQRELGFCIR